VRKRIIESATIDKRSDTSEGWLKLEHLAHVEVTSEDSACPIEAVFDSTRGCGWRSARPGKQTIRVIFDSPQEIRRIWLHFAETQAERTQEFTLHWWPDRQTPREIVRQQWTFSPQGSTTEIEDLKVDLCGVSLLELTINPNLSGGESIASLAEWRLA
jgi:hypothetical protein